MQINGQITVQRKSARWGVHVVHNLDGEGRFILRDGTPVSDDLDTIYKVRTPIVACERGLHFTDQFENTFPYIPRSYLYTKLLLTYVLVWGQLDIMDDKGAAQYRQITKKKEISVHYIQVLKAGILQYLQTYDPTKTPVSTITLNALTPYPAVHFLQENIPPTLMLAVTVEQLNHLLAEQLDMYMSNFHIGKMVVDEDSDYHEKLEININNPAPHLNRALNDIKQCSKVRL